MHRNEEEKKRMFDWNLTAKLSCQKMNGKFFLKKIIIMAFIIGLFCEFIFKYKIFKNL